MSTSPHDEPQLGQEEVGKGPGARLREARERVGLSVEDVAARLHLDRHTVESLEADRFDALPAPTFVRGYLRAYARLIDLPHAPITESFDRRGLAPPPLIADIATGQEAHSSDLPMRFATYGIIAVLVVLAVVWWKNQRVDEGVDPMSVVDTTTSAQPANTPSEANPTPSATNAASAEPPANASSETGAGETAAGAETPAKPFAFPAPSEATGVPTTSSQTPPPASTGEARNSAASETANPAAPSAQSAIAAPTASSSTSGSTSGATPSTDAPTPTPATSEQTANAPAGRLVVRFAADSWVEIYDSTDKRLYFNLAKGGRTVDVAGVPPLRVLIGYVDGVKIEYNGRPYDFSAHVRKGVARFELGSN